ncbi:MAG: hypothetical protein ACE5LX_05810 [Nitrospinota bacterium]
MLAALNHGEADRVSPLFRGAFATTITPAASGKRLRVCEARG